MDAEGHQPCWPEAIRQRIHDRLLKKLKNLGVSPRQENAQMQVEDEIHTGNMCMDAAAYGDDLVFRVPVSVEKHFIVGLLSLI